MRLRRVGSATDRDSLSTRHADASPVLVEEDTAVMAQLLLARLVAQVGQAVDGLLILCCVGVDLDAMIDTNKRH